MTQKPTHLVDYRVDFPVHNLEVAAILRHLGFPLKKIALRSKDGMPAFIFAASVQPEVVMIRARIEQLKNDVRQVRLEEAEQVAASKARQRQNGTVSLATVGEILEGRQ